MAVLALLWLFLGWKACNDYNECCGKGIVVEPKETAIIAPVVKKSTIPCTGIICFEKNGCNPLFCDGWVSLRDSISNTLGSEQKLLITGYSTPSESYNGEYKNLGLCRADKVRKAIEAFFGDIQVEIAGQLRVGGAASITSSCDRISFRTIGASAKVNSSTLIYFPFNSTKKLADSSVETYLQQVATQVKKSKQRVRLTGHTDSNGEDAYNVDLGRKRANIIKNYLVAQGVSSSMIITSSKGESQPVANNNSEQGRAKNRRTELEIID